MTSKKILWIYLVIGCVLFQIVIGWLVPLFLCLFFSGFVFEQNVVLKTSLIGLVLNSFNVVFVYFYHNAAANEILGDLSDILAGIDPSLVMGISLLIPVVLFALAGFVSQNSAFIYHKIKG